MRRKVFSVYKMVSLSTGDYIWRNEDATPANLVDEFRTEEAAVEYILISGETNCVIVPGEYKIPLKQLCQEFMTKVLSIWPIRVDFTELLVKKS